MRTPVLFLLTATLTLSACQSRWNPANWWGADQESVVQTDVNPLIPEKTEDGQSFFASQEQAQYTGVPVQRVSRAETHRVPEGQLIVAVGIAETHGMHDVRLVARDGGAIEAGVLTLDLMAIPPNEPIIGGSDLTRQLTAAVVLTDQQISGVRTIRITGAENSLEERIR